jgi:hypothetical protein
MVVHTKGGCGLLFLLLFSWKMLKNYTPLPPRVLLTYHPLYSTKVTHLGVVFGAHTLSLKRFNAKL